MKLTSSLPTLKPRHRGFADGVFLSELTTPDLFGADQTNDPARPSQQRQRPIQRGSFPHHRSCPFFLGAIPRTYSRRPIFFGGIPQRFPAAPMVSGAAPQRFLRAPIFSGDAPKRFFRSPFFCGVAPIRFSHAPNFCWHAPHSSGAALNPRPTAPISHAPSPLGRRQSPQRAARPALPLGRSQPVFRSRREGLRQRAG